MARAGSHKATVILDGKADGLNKAAKGASDRVAKLEATVEKLQGAFDRTNKRLDAFEKKAGGNGFGRLRSAFADTTIAVRGMIDGLRSAADTIDKVLDRSFRLDNVQANLPFSIEAARQATQGLVSDFDLMQQAITANRLGVAKNSAEFAEAAQTATKLGVSVGQDATQALDDFVNGLGRGSTEVLDNLGIMLRAEEAHRLYAAQIGKTAQQLNDVEKKQAVMTIGLQKGVAIAETAKVKVDGLAGSWEQLKVHVANAADDVLRFNENARELAKEGLLNLGQSSREADKSLENLAEAGRDLQLGVLDVLAPGMSTAARVTEEFAEANDEITRSIERGKVTYSVLFDFLHQTGSAGERAVKTLNNVKRAFKGVRELNRAEEFAKGQTMIADLFGTMAIAEQKLQDELKNQRKDNAQARLEIAIDEARQLEQIAQRRMRVEGLSSQVAVDAIARRIDAERRLAKFEAANAQAPVDRIRARHQAEMAMARGLEEIGELRRRDAEEQIALDKRRAKATQAAVSAMREQDLVLAEIDQNRALRAAERVEDPVERLEAEVAARLALIDVQERAANDVVSRLQLADQREAAIHDLKMARIAAETAAREEQQAKFAAIADQTVDLHMSVAEAALRAAILGEGSVRKAVASIAKQRAFEFGVIEGPSELIKAGIAAASLNPAKAAAHLANAGQAFAFAASMGAIAGAASAGGGRIGVGGGLADATTLGGGEALPGSRGGGSGGPAASGSRPGPIPPSQLPPSGASPAPAPQQSGPMIVIEGDVIGVPKREFLRDLDRGLRDLGYGNRRAG